MNVQQRSRGRSWFFERRGDDEAGQDGLSSPLPRGLHGHAGPRAARDTRGVSGVEKPRHGQHGPPGPLPEADRAQGCSAGTGGPDGAAPSHPLLSPAPPARGHRRGRRRGPGGPRRARDRSVSSRYGVASRSQNGLADRNKDGDKANAWAALTLTGVPLDSTSGTRHRPQAPLPLAAPLKRSTPRPEARRMEPAPKHGRERKTHTRPRLGTLCSHMCGQERHCHSQRRDSELKGPSPS